MNTIRHFDFEAALIAYENWRDGDRYGDDLPVRLDLEDGELEAALAAIKRSEVLR